MWLSLSMRMLSGLMSLYTPSATRQGYQVPGSVPMNEAELVDCFDALGHVEACDILRECVVLDEHGHQVAAR
jgi:hypothetical protein